MRTPSQSSASYEELLDSIISAFVFHSEFIGPANLRFVQKVSIARSMSLDEHENAMWEIATKLNSLRNELAHKLDSPKRAAKTRAVVKALDLDMNARRSPNLTTAQPTS